MPVLDLAALERALARYERRLVGTLRGACATASSETVTGTPVDEGDLRASWTPTNGEPRANNRSGGADQNISSVVNTLEPGDTYSLANGQPYARAIEYEGHSAQAPAGMVGPVAARWGAIGREAAEEARRGD